MFRAMWCANWCGGRDRYARKIGCVEVSRVLRADGRDDLAPLFFSAGNRKGAFICGLRGGGLGGAGAAGTGVRDGEARLVAHPTEVGC